MEIQFNLNCLIDYLHIIRIRVELDIFQGWPGYVPGYIPIQPTGLDFFRKKTGFLIESGFFDKTFIIFYNNRSYYTF